MWKVPEKGYTAEWGNTEANTIQDKTVSVRKDDDLSRHTHIHLHTLADI